VAKPYQSLHRLPGVLWLLPPLLALLPHLQYLPVWLSLTCLGAWFWRLGLALADKPLPARLLRILLALAALAGVFWQFGNIVGQQAGVPLFILLLFVKLLETTRLAEKRLLLILTQFAAMSYFLTGQSLPVTAYLLAVSVLGVAVMAHLQSGLAPRLALRLSVVLFAGGLPLALLLFIFFPRLDHALWSLPQDQASASTGLSDSMGPGDISNLIQSGEIAFRAQFTDTPPDPNGLYWRGPVLADFDGRAWHALPFTQAFNGRLEGRGAPLQMTLTLEPHQRRWLFAPGLPDPLPAGTTLAAGLQWIANAPVTQRQRWELRVFPNYLHLEGREALVRALALPEGFNPRSRDLARAWREKDPRPQALVRQAQDLYRQSFHYTLRPPRLGVHSVDDFLFTTQRGFCEHYASSFVFLMRAAGVPARVVTGYLGGEVNPLDGHVAVRQSDAHAWAEVWLGPEQGWTRVDPTASVSPARVERGIAAALPAMELPPGLVRLSLPWLQDLRHTWEMLNNGWNQWVLGYGQTQQLRLLARLSPALASTRWLASAAILAGILGLTVLAWLYWRGQARVRPDKAALAWRKLEHRLGTLGLAPQVGEAPHHYAQRVASTRPDLAQAVTEIARLYLVVRYGNGMAQLPRLQRLTAGFRPQRPAMR
jgi:transglutaminase-like putative cysteine protease